MAEKSIIQVSQNRGDELEEIATMEGLGWAWAQRVLGVATRADDDDPLHCLVEPVDEKGDLLDDPILIHAHTAAWFVGEFCGLPELAAEIQLPPA